MTGIFLQVFQLSSKQSTTGRQSYNYSSGTVLYIIYNSIKRMADTSGHAVYGVGLRLLDCWKCGFESGRGLGCLSFLTPVSCQVNISASGWSLIQRGPTECMCMSECDREASIIRRTLVHCEVAAQWGKNRTHRLKFTTYSHFQFRSPARPLCL
jgi:hypothetical protein